MPDHPYRRPRTAILLTSSLVCGIFALCALAGLLLVLVATTVGPGVAALVPP